jgi:hypothetical protein
VIGDDEHGTRPWRQIPGTVKRRYTVVAMHRAIAWLLATIVLLAAVLLTTAVYRQGQQEPVKTFNGASVDCAAPYTASPATDAIGGWKCVK